MIRLYNAMSGKVESFEPLRPGEVKMYVCGLTLSDDAHLGHGRAAAVFDLLRRFFTYLGWQVLYVRNITDVDDKIFRRAVEQKMTPDQMVDRYLERHAEDLERLRVPRADIEPRASEHIGEMIRFIERLVERGAAYEKDGSVYFKTASVPEFGLLAQVAGIEGENEDFLLWKTTAGESPCWDSPWGCGRPGWHIECSTMSMEFLGEHFDIHGGGVDLLHPHHDAEIAQCHALSGCAPAKVFMHNALVNLAEEKMSKSIGNFFTLKEIFARYDPAVVRHYLFNSHYRKAINYQPDELEYSSRFIERVETFRRAAADITDVPLQNVDASGPEIKELLRKKRSEVIDALEDDLDTPAALRAIEDVVKAGCEHLESPNPDPMHLGRIEEFLDEFDEIFDLRPDASSTLSRKGELVEGILELRRRLEQTGTSEASRLADEITGTLRDVGVELIDTPWGTRWDWK